MKKLLFLGIVGLFYTVAIAQNTSQIKRHPLPLAVYGDNLDSPLTQKERGFILEVYGDYAQKYVFDNPQRLKDIKNLLRNRIVIEKNRELKQKKDGVKLASIPLFNSYVPDIKRDANFNPNSFNPLKYNLEFFSNEAKLYVVDGSDYIILIKSQYQK